MRALSLRQPWAWMVVHGGKTIENRRWNTSFRGEVLIHAAKGMTREEYEDAVDFASEVDPTLIVPRAADLERGGIVGRARVIAVLPPCRTGATLLAEPCAHPWHMPGQFGFVLSDIAPLPFRPLRGELGFFDAMVRP